MAIESNKSGQTPSQTSNERPETQKPDPLRQDIRTRAALPKELKVPGGTENSDSLKINAKEVVDQAVDTARQGARQIVRESDAALDSLRSAKEHAFDSISEGVGQVSERARAAGHSVSGFAATHAIPLTLLGAGAGWLLVSMSRQRRSSAARYLSGGRYGYTERGVLSGVRERAAELSDRASTSLARTGHLIADRAHDLQSNLGDRAGELGTQVKNGAHYVGHEAAELGQQAYDGIEWASTQALEVSERNPLTVGLVALAAGAAVAMLLPPTRRENELLGQTRDRLIQSAQRSAQQLKENVQSRAQQAVDDVREVVDEMSNPGSTHA